MPYFFYSLLSISIVLLTTGGVAVANGSIKAKAAHQYPAEFVQSYNQECMQTSMQEGLDKAEAKRLCDCTINEFERQYSLTEFKRLTAASRTDKASETTLIEVGQFCFEQILYEE
jgi:hypothetical protein